MKKVPHLVQYQGSKRIIAPEIIKYFPADIKRVVEPFSGTCAVSIYAASKGIASEFWLNDINKPLIEMMKLSVEDPIKLANGYEKIWNGQFEKGEDNISYYYKVRDAFNAGNTTPEYMLFILSRVVKGAIRYNGHGVMNQGCDKRRFGTKPNVLKMNAVEISNLLKGKATFTSEDYQEVLKNVTRDDVVYMDPPYQGTSRSSRAQDSRYIQGVDFDQFTKCLFDLNARGIRYIVSYDGWTGEKKIGKNLPEELKLTHLLIDAGLSAQSLLNGKKEITRESLYLSPGIKIAMNRPEQQHLEL